MKDFKAYYIIPAEPEMVYRALTTENTIQLWTGEDATMAETPGSEFAMWSGSIVGRNLTFDPGKLIEQQWYFGDTEPEHPSIVRIKLHAHKKGTSMEVRHSNIPEEAYEEITEGWENTFAAALIDFYAE